VDVPEYRKSLLILAEGFSVVLKQILVVALLFQFFRYVLLDKVVLLSELDVLFGVVET
jgi:hypothetical protein